MSLRVGVDRSPYPSWLIEERHMRSQAPSTAGSTSRSEHGMQPSFGTAEMREDPYPFYDSVRTACPVYKIPERNDYLLTRREDVVYVANHPEVFSSAGTQRESVSPELRYSHAPALSDNDPPEHTIIRKALFSLFTPARMRTYRPLVQHEVDLLIDAFVDEQQIEFVDRFANPLPTRVIGSLLGIPTDMFGQLKQWSDDNTELLGGFYAPERRRPLERSYADFINFCGDQIVERRSRPCDDLLTELSQAKDSRGKLFSVEKMANAAKLFILGGNETTTYMLANAIVDLLQNPNEIGDTEDDRYLVKMLEEALRKESPAAWTQRRCTVDHGVNGVTIPAGARVLIGWGAANRDPQIFESAQSFRVERSNAKQSVAFGHGPHFCMGAALARLEGCVAFSTLFTRFRSIRLAPQNTFLHITRMLQVRAVQQVYVELEKA
jgi:cytochrome P450